MTCLDEVTEKRIQIVFTAGGRRRKDNLDERTMNRGRKVVKGDHDVLNIWALRMAALQKTVWLTALLKWGSIHQNRSQHEAKCSKVVLIMTENVCTGLFLHGKPAFRAAIRSS